MWPVGKQFKSLKEYSPLDHILTLHGGEVDGIHLPVQHRVQGEVRGKVTGYQGHHGSVLDVKEDGFVWRERH